MAPARLLESPKNGDSFLLHKSNGATCCDDLFSPSSLMHRSLLEIPPTVAHATGSVFTLKNRLEILDGCGGAGLLNIGTGNQEVLAAMSYQANRVPYVYTGLYTTSAAEELAKMVLESPSSGFQHGLVQAYFCSSGSEATDSAMKLAKQYHYERGDTDRIHFVSRLQSYHGSTIGAMSISSNLGRKIPYQGILLPNVSFVSPAFSYHYQLEFESEAEFGERLVAEVDEEFQRIGPHKIISFIAETVVGATSGCVTAPKGYFAGVRNLCDRYGILLHLDEVMCGLGRTGTYFAFEQENIKPDMVTIGKGLAAGYAPVAGVLMNRRIFNAIANGSAKFNHGFTYQNQAVGMAAALAVQRVVKRECLVSRVARLEPFLRQLLLDTFSGSSHVGDIRGRGFLLCVEFVADAQSRTAFPAGLNFAHKIQKRTHDLGVDVYPGTGTVDGYQGDHIIIAPAFNMAEKDLRRIVCVLKEAYTIEAALL